MAATEQGGRFDRKVAVVTGAGSGIGKQVALDLAHEGARVAVNDIDDSTAEAVCAEIRAAGGECLAAPGDVSDSSAVEHLVAQVVARWSRIDVLVNNAGVLLTGTLEEMSDEIIDRTLAVNVKGVLYMTRAIAALMKRNRYGKIVNVASVTGKRGDSSTFPAYGASKGAVISFTRSIARALGPYNVNCNAIAPHAVMTAMMSYWDEERRKNAAQRIPLQRLGTVQDMSNLIRFLASDESSFVTGETVNINGGFYMD